MLLVNEWRYLIRQPLLWLACVILPLVAYVFATGITGIDTLADKRLQALHMTLLMICLPLLSGALAPLVFLRDQANDMAELILVTPQSVFKRLFARLCMLFLVCAGLLLLSFIIMWFMLSLTYGFKLSLLGLSLWNFALMALPTCAFFSALACCLAQRFASNVVIYAIFCSVWLGYLILASMTGAPMLAGSTISSPWLFSILRIFDPFGNTPLLAFYHNVEPRLYGDLIFYLNRLFYALCAAGLFYLGLNVKAYTVKHSPLPKQASQATQSRQTYKFVDTRPNAAQQLKQLSALALTTLLKQRVNQLLLVAWTFLMGNEVLSGIHYVEPLSVLHPTSLDALNRISDDVLPLMGSFLLLFWTWQLCWRNRHTAMAELIAAAPVRSGILLLSQLLALSALIMLLMTLTALASLAAEIMANSDIQPVQYVDQLSRVGLSLFILAALFSVFHTVCRSPLVAAAWCVAILVMKFTPLSGTLGLTHTLWNIAASPLQPADAFWGSEQSQSVYWPFMLFWFVLSFSLLWIAVRWSHRTTAFVNHSRWKLSLSSVLLLLVTVACGLNLHHKIISERPLMSSDLREQWRADYETQYAAWADVPQPVISHIDAQVDIFPQTEEARFSLNYTLQNRTEQAIRQLLVGNDLATLSDELKMSVAFTSEFDQELGQTIVSLDKALAPGEQLTLGSVLHFKQPQHWPAVMHQFVKPSFSYLRGIPLLPTIGFQGQYRLRDEQLREEYGLAPLNLAPPSILFANPLLNQSDYDWVSIRSVVSTNARQVPLAQGQLIKEWQENGRNYAEYQTAGPIRNASVWLSVPEHSIKHQTSSTLFEVFSPHDTEAAQLNMQAMLDTVGWMTTHIAPYRGKRLNLIAMPDMGASGYALPQMMMINHREGFLAKPAPDAGFDQRYRRAVHETAHQWFGHDLGNSVLADSAFLVESLAKYIELVLIEKHYGQQAMQALVKHEQQRYKTAMMRSTLNPPALVDATENHDLYSRATLVFAILREKLGDEQITRALRILWQQHAYPLTPATSMDFVRALKAQVDETQQTLVDDLFLGTDVGMLLKD